MYSVPMQNHAIHIKVSPPIAHRMHLSIYVHLCPSMSIYVHLCPSMSIYVHLCPSMSICPPIPHPQAWHDISLHSPLYFQSCKLVGIDPSHPSHPSSRRLAQARSGNLPRALRGVCRSLQLLQHSSAIFSHDAVASGSVSKLFGYGKRLFMYIQERSGVQNLVIQSALEKVSGVQLHLSVNWAWSYLVFVSVCEFQHIWSRLRHKPIWWKKARGKHQSPNC